MPAPFACPYCAAPLVVYDAGHSEFPLQCDACGAAMAVDEAAGEVRTRRWDRALARGVHETLKLDSLSRLPEEKR